MIYLLHAFTIPLAIIYSHVMECIIHKHILHNLGKNKKSPWSFHWHAHHRKCRKYNYYDEDYLNNWVGPPRKEIIGLFVLVLLHTPLLMLVPLFSITVAIQAIRYYKIHSYSHLNPSWAKQNLRWHYDHHMGDDQDSNWGVTNEWVDKLIRTRKRYENY